MVWLPVDGLYVDEYYDDNIFVLHSGYVSHQSCNLILLVNVLRLTYHGLLTRSHGNAVLSLHESFQQSHKLVM